MGFYFSDDLSIAILVISLLAAIVLTILFAPKKKRDSLTGFGAWLSDLINFRSLFVEYILKFLYVFATCFVIVVGLFGMIVALVEGYQFIFFLRMFLFTLLAPVAIRLAFELLMMAVLLVTNVIEINKKLPYAKNPAAPTASQPAPAPAAYRPTAPQPAPNPSAYRPAAPQPAPSAPHYTFCTQCGTKYDASLGVCPNCGKK